VSHPPIRDGPACIAKQFAVPPPISQSFHLPFVEQSQDLAHLLQRSVLLILKTLFLKAVKQLRYFFFCFRVLFYRINTHALKNAFQLQNNSKFILGRGPLANIISLRGNPLGLGNRFSVVQCIVP
jgi:hypothetical protein